MKELRGKKAARTIEHYIMLMLWFSLKSGSLSELSEGESQYLRAHWNVEGAA